MAGTKPTVCLFDLDGTIIESAPGIVASVKYAEGKLRLTAPAGFDYNLFVGPPLHLSFMKYFALDEEGGRLATQIYREYYRERGLFDCAVYPGMAETLAALRAGGIRMGVATSKPTVFAERILDHFGLARYFESVDGSNLDNTNSKKADVIAGAIARYRGSRADGFLMVGDRREDIVGARENGVRSCGALWGYGTREELVEAGADFLAGNAADLPAILGLA
jgi:phosphoglycolate phosphatase